MKHFLNCSNKVNKDTIDNFDSIARLDVVFMHNALPFFFELC